MPPERKLTVVEGRKLLEQSWSEHDHQKTLIHWCADQARYAKELSLIYAIPNAAKRSPGLAGRMLAEGLKKGVPDLCLPVARGKHHGLYIELKKPKGGRLSTDQEMWISALQKQGYRAQVCYGWREARDTILSYLGG